MALTAKKGKKTKASKASTPSKTITVTHTISRRLLAKTLFDFGIAHSLENANTIVNSLRENMNYNLDAYYKSQHGQTLYPEVIQAIKSISKITEILNG